jgi:hypothetical protein
MPTTPPKLATAGQIMSDLGPWKTALQVDFSHTTFYVLTYVAGSPWT